MRRKGVRLVLLDVDYTLIRPLDLFEGRGYAALAARLGVTLDAARFEAAMAAATEAVWGPDATLDHRPDERLRFPTLLARAMGADDEAARLVAAAAADAWDDPANFELYDDVRETLEELADRDVPVGLVSNTHRDLTRFLAPWRLPFRFALTSGAHGRSKPCPTIFRAALAAGRSSAEQSVMVGDSLHGDVNGAAACGIRAILLDRDDRHAGHPVERVRTLRDLGAILGLRRLDEAGSTA